MFRRSAAPFSENANHSLRRCEQIESDPAHARQPIQLVDVLLSERGLTPICSHLLRLWLHSFAADAAVFGQQVSCSLTWGRELSLATKPKALHQLQHFLPHQTELRLERIDNIEVTGAFKFS
jgi:hypothetical protein